MSLTLERKGASSIIVVMLFAVSMMFAFLAINMANIQRHQAASQIATDLGARWGVDMITRDTDLEVVENQVKDMVARNWTLNDRTDEDWLQQNLQDIDIDVVFGSARATGDGWDFRVNQFPTNGVQVNTQSSIGVAGLADSERNQIGIGRTATSVALERDICLVIDRSGSMNWDLDTGTWSADRSVHWYNPISQVNSNYWRWRRHYWWRYWPHPDNSRWATMIPAVYELGEELEETRQNELLSIVSYSTAYNSYVYTHGGGVRTRRYRANVSGVEVNPTFDYEAAATTLDNKYQWNQPVMGGTNISAGIDEAIRVLTGPSARPNAYKTMIVMTDGQYNQGRAPWLAAADAAREGIEVFTVTFSRHADQGAMETTAVQGNGQHFHAPDGEALTEIFKAIANIPPAAYLE